MDPGTRANTRTRHSVTDDPRRSRARAVIFAASTARADGQLCSACLDVLPVSGAAVSLLAGELHQQTLCASDEVAERLDELQFDLGEGPCWEAVDTGRPVLVPNLRLQNPTWPLFRDALQDSPAAAVFAFPLRIGAIGVGALDLYRDRPGPLEPSVLEDALALADALSWVVLRRLLGEHDEADGGDRYGRTNANTRREIHQATGMIIAQLATTPQGAFSLLRARAFAEGRSVREVARDVVHRRLRFDDPAGA